MSGTNRLIQSTLGRKGESALAQGLLNANEVAAAMQGRGDARKGQKKEKKTGK